MQIEGPGGSNLLTSKIAITGPPTVEDADLDYPFAQVEITGDVDYAGNCGKISAAVGPYAIDEGLVRSVEGTTKDRIHNTNTQKILVARVTVPRRAGGCRIAGGGGTALRSFSTTVRPWAPRGAALFQLETIPIC